MAVSKFYLFIYLLTALVFLPVTELSGICESPLDPFPDPILSATSSSCLTLSWDHYYCFSSYSYSCAGRPTVYTTSRSAKVCGFSPYREVSCWVRERETGLTRSTSARTDCAAPGRPYSRGLNHEEQVSHSGGLRWISVVSWQEPTINCASISRYNVWYNVNNQSWVSTSRTGTSFSIQVDPYGSLSVMVSAKNNHNLVSGNATITGTVPSLRPYVSPRSVALTGLNSACATLSWQPPQWPNGITGYQYKCTGSSIWTTIAIALRRTVCGFSPYQKVLCDIRAVNGAGYSDVSTSNEIRLDCAAPETPKNLQYNYSATTYSGRVRWTLTIYWQQPTINCASLSRYDIWYKIQNQNWVFTYTTSTTKYMYTDGNEQIQVFVAARNNAGLESTNATLQFTSPTLRPQLHPKSVMLTNPSSECVTLSWQQPQWPNGPITGYQYKCTGSSIWTTIANVLSRTVCGFSPYQKVQCDMRAVNSAGYSDVASSNEILTHCAAPETPKNLQYNYSTTTYSGRVRWRLTIYWQRPTSNCATISGYNVWYQVQNQSWTSTNVAGTYFSIYTDGKELVKVLVAARNNAGLESTNATLQFTSPTLRPQLSPKLVMLTNPSFECVTLNWQQPQWPNGPITGYQHKCTGAASWTQLANVTSCRICGFSPYKQVLCDIRAVNSAGYSDVSSSNEIHTDCAAPGEPSNLQHNNSEVTSSGRQRWKVTISWQGSATSNCACISGYKIWYQTQNQGWQYSYVSSTAINIYVDGNEQVQVFVAARNNAGLESTNATLQFTSPTMRPQLGPRSVVLANLNSTCVTLSWQPPEWPNGLITEYQYKFKDTAGWSTINGNISSHAICGFSPFEQVQCNIRAWNGEGFSEVSSSDEIKTNCSAPGEPRNLQHNSSEVTISGRQRWKVTISWQKPIINCAILSQYNAWYQIQNQSWISTYTTSTYISIYTDGNEQIQVSVAARNNAGLESTNAALQLTSPTLRPQLGPGSVVLSDPSSTCLNLSWQPPEWPNGPITGYQYACNGVGYWNDTGNVTSHVICEFSTYEQVQCNIRAVNGAGFSDVSSSNEIRTNCAAPSNPVLRITDSVTTASDGKDKVTVLVTWQPVAPNCRQVIYYNVSLGSIHQIIVPSDNLKFQANDLEPHQNYTIYVNVVNDGNLVTTTESVWKTKGTRPAPPSFDLIFNTSCVSLSISAPEFPYNFVTHYKYNCQQETDEVTFLNATAPASSIVQGELRTLCGFLSAAEVSCDVSAANTVGESLSVQNSGYTQLKLLSAEPVTIDIDESLVFVNIPVVKLENQAVSVGKYQLILSLPRTNQTTKRSASNVLDVCNTTQLLDYAAATDLDLSCYIAAEIEGSVVGNDGYTFTLGDGNIYGGFYNAPLLPGEGYALMVAVVVDFENDQVLRHHFSSVDFTCPAVPVTVLGVFAEPDTECSTGCVIGVSFSSIIILVVVAVALICLKRRHGEASIAEISDVSLADISTISTGTGQHYGAVVNTGYHPQTQQGFTNIYDEVKPPRGVYENVDIREKAVRPAQDGEEVKEESQTVETTGDTVGL